MTAPLQGRFVTLEGGEGSGKSTLINSLAKRAKEHDISAEVTREPGGTPLAEAVRNLALNPGDGEKWSPLAEALLMNAARVDHLEKRIRPALERGQWILCDRFSDSTLAYQSAGGEVPMPTLLTIEASVLEWSRPDLTLILDAPVEVLAKRREARNETHDSFEERPLSFHRAVRNAFLQIAQRNPDRCVVLDAEQAPGRILEEAWAAIEARCLSGAGRA
ncbi:MAG: dTMP kinase [Pseudomonadota bacterium]